MPDNQPREPFRSFTLRVPQSLYVEMAEMARADGVFINQKANQLIRLGMGKHINLDQALARMLKDEVVHV
jgi:hypothetical protein